MHSHVHIAFAVLFFLLERCTEDARRERRTEGRNFLDREKGTKREKQERRVKRDQKRAGKNGWCCIGIAQRTSAEEWKNKCKVTLLMKVETICVVFDFCTWKIINKRKQVKRIREPKQKYRNNQQPKIQHGPETRTHQEKNERRWKSQFLFCWHENNTVKKQWGKKVDDKTGEQTHTHTHAHTRTHANKQ